ncbi:MAG TPA: glycosyltransferase [Hanamia sp.]|nr:glycosyltransferase [Hanamia sp.]
MKILFFIDSLQFGGKERRLVELMKGIKPNTDIEFELVVMNKDIQFHEVFDLGIRIHYLIRKTKKDLSVFQKFYKICKIYSPYIVHCWDSMTAVYAIPSCKLLNLKLVNGLIVDAPVRQNIFNKHWFRAQLTFPFSNIIIANSKAGLAAYKVPTSKSYLIYNGFNFNRSNNIIQSDITRKELKINTKYIIGMIASFSVYKDYKTYFKAAQLLLNQRNDITFLAIGNNTDSTLAKNLIESKYLDHFKLLGKISGVESLINAMDICVLSTFTEGISNSILEYMALGKPVIASSGGGTDEIIENTKTGFLINQSNPAELSEKIEILLKDPELRNQMGTAGQKRIKKMFSIESMSNQYISFYESC